MLQDPMNSERGVPGSEGGGGEEEGGQEEGGPDSTEVQVCVGLRMCVFITRGADSETQVQGV